MHRTLSQHFAMKKSHSRGVTTVSTVHVNCNDEQALTPYDFIRYLPWAAKKFQIEYDVVVKKCIIQVAGRSQKRNSHGGSRASTVFGRNSAASGRSSTGTDRTSSASGRRPTATSAGQNKPDLDFKQEVEVNQTSPKQNLQKCVVFADYLDNSLVSVRFMNNVHMPRVLFQVFAMIVPFHPTLHSVVINQGLEKYSMLELSNALPPSNIVEINLDDTFVKEGNYYLLLENANSLKILSLARCFLNDDVIERMALKLHFPQPASKTLIALNVSSNLITDIGVRHIAIALRSNRKLAYLNLAGNMISSDGAIALLNALSAFQLNSEEVKDFDNRNETSFLRRLKTQSRLLAQRQKQQREQQRLEENKENEMYNKNRSAYGKKGVKKIKPPSPKYEPGVGPTSIFDVHTNMLNLNPYQGEETFTRYGMRYSRGNPTLKYLNLIYNNITFEFLYKLQDLVEYQAERDKEKVEQGLFVIKLEGNPLPENCPQYETVRLHLHNKLNMTQQKFTKIKFGKIMSRTIVQNTSANN